MFCANWGNTAAIAGEMGYPPRDTSMDITMDISMDKMVDNQLDSDATLSL